MTTQPERAYELEAWRAPALAEGDELLFCEHGRIVYRDAERLPGRGTDCRSHWFRVVKNGGAFALLVKHGGGEQRVQLGYDYRNQALIFGSLPTDLRYWLLWIILEAHNSAARDARAATAHEHKRAFAEGRLRKRKARGSDAVKVWIEPEVTNSGAPAA